MTTALPRAEWTQRTDLAELAAVLGPENMRWVGGIVRDTLLGAPGNDMDAATTLTPDEVLQHLRGAGIKAVPTGIEHGTITAVLDRGPVEITTLRHDVSTDGRRATVAFAREWQEDAARRDFTINALYAHPETLEISDYFGGLADLEARRIRFIGDAAERIAEDHLRILRYFRFQARFGAVADTAAEEACRAGADKLENLSRERVAMELLALLALPDPVPTLRRMAELTVLPAIMPETRKPQLDVLEALIAAEAAQGFAADPIRRLAAMLPALPDIANTVALRLRLSRAQRDRLACVAARTDRDANQMQALAYREGSECAIDRLLIGGHDVSRFRNWLVPELPLSGGAIVKRGIAPGPQVSHILRRVEDRWIAEGFPDEARVAQLLDDELGKENAQE